MANPRVAVLMAVYNGSLWIEEQISSIQSQVDVDVNIYINLDKSDDDSIEKILRICEINSNVTFLGESKFGSAGKNFYSILKNKKISNEFDYYCLADQDDLWLPEKLSRAIYYLKEGKVDGYSSNVTAFWDDGYKKIIKKSQPQRNWDFLFEAAGPGCTYVLNNDLYKEIVSFISDSSIPVEIFEAHDWFIYAFARSRGYKWFIDDKSLMLYRQHQNNQVGANVGIQAYTKRFKQIFSGDWFIRVENLIKILSLEELKPASYLINKKPIDYFKLSLLSKNLRRRRLESIYLSFLFFIYAIKIILRK